MFEKVNYKLIIKHTFAGFFFLWAVREFIFLYDSELLRIYDQWDFIDAWRLNDKAERIGKFIAYKITSSYIALLISLIISLIITIKKKYGGINSFIVFLICILCLRFDLITNDYVESVVYFPGEILYGFSVKSVTLNGILLLVTGLCFYFLEIAINAVRKKTKNKEKNLD